RTDSAGHPTDARLQNDLVNRCTADAEEHVVVHLETLNTFKNLDARTYLTLSQDERVVYKPVSPIGVASTVATNARHSRALRSNMLKHVANDVRVFSSRILANVLVPVRVRPDQLNLTVKTTRDPVVIDLIAFGAALYVVATVLIVKITILHAKHGTGMRDLVGGHVNRMLAGSVPAVVNLHVLHQKRTGVSVGSQDAVGRTVMHNTIAQRNVVCVVIDSSKRAAGYIEAFEDVVIR